MEGDAKGQIGGLEASAKDRERLAGQSGNWRCGICGRSNGETMAECEEKARESEAGDGKKQVAEVLVPKELQLEYKDDLKAASASEKEGSQVQPQDFLGGQEGASEEAELAEGFVRTGLATSIEASSSTNTIPYPAARPAQSVPQPTGTTTTTQPQSAPPAVTAPARIATAYPQHVVQRS